MTTLVKICGLKSADACAAAAAAGADYLGFVFYPPSPRAITPAEAGALGRAVPAGGPRKVAVTVDPDNALLTAIVDEARPDIIQLHGSETPERVADIRQRFARPVMKAIAVAERDDVAAARAFEAVADLLLFDAKPPKNRESLPGGNGLGFDWRLLADERWACPWLLAGGLTADNVAAAIRLTHAPGVDVASGVESAPGVKDLDKIRQFISVAKSAHEDTATRAPHGTVRA